MIKQIRQWNLLYYSVGGKKSVKRKQKNPFAFNRALKQAPSKRDCFPHLVLSILVDILFCPLPQPALQAINCKVLTELTCIAPLSLFSSLHYVSSELGLPCLSPDHTAQPRLTHCWVSKYGLQTNSITWGLVSEMQILRPLSRPPESDILGVASWRHWLKESSRCFWYVHKSQNYCSNHSPLCQVLLPATVVLFTTVSFQSTDMIGLQNHCRWWLQPWN